MLAICLELMRATYNHSHALILRHFRMNTYPPFNHAHIYLNAPVELSCLYHRRLSLARCHTSFNVCRALYASLACCFVTSFSDSSSSFGIDFCCYYFCAHLRHTVGSAKKGRAAGVEGSLLLSNFTDALPAAPRTFYHYVISESVCALILTHTLNSYSHFQVEVLPSKLRFSSFAASLFHLFYLSAHTHKKCICVITFFYA